MFNTLQVIWKKKLSILSSNWFHGLVNLIASLRIN